MDDNNTIRPTAEPASSTTDNDAAHPDIHADSDVMAAEETVRSVHPAADIFPPLEDDEFDALVTDIKLHGLREAITLDAHNFVLEGRNRLRACRVAGITPHFKRWDERGSPLDYVVSMNLHRRHLDQGQRAMIASRTCGRGSGPTLHNVAKGCLRGRQPDY